MRMYISLEILDIFYFLKFIAYNIHHSFVSDTEMLEYVYILQTIKTTYDLIASP